MTFRVWAPLAAAAMVLGVSAAAASEGNWIRARVHAVERAAMARFTAAAEPEARRVVGGTPVKAGQWPFLVALVKSDVDDNFEAQFCGASLIAKNFVLTAAHCVAELDFADDIQVLVGTHDLEDGGERFDVDEIAFHEDYDPDTVDNDIALIELVDPVAGITPVKVLTAAQERTLAATGKQATVIGWGNTSATDDVFLPIARQATFPIIAKSVCNGPNSYDGQLTDNMFCAGVMKGGKDSCQGDSGGPLVVKDATGKFRVQAGVVSFGEGCAQKNFPGVYTRLARYGKWIAETKREMLAN